MKEILMLWWRFVVIEYKQVGIHRKIKEKLRVVLNQAAIAYPTSQKRSMTIALNDVKHMLGL
jgi:hypothetical protein